MKLLAVLVFILLWWGLTQLAVMLFSPTANIFAMSLGALIFIFSDKVQSLIGGDDEKI